MKKTSKLETSKSIRAMHPSNNVLAYLIMYPSKIQRKFDKVTVKQKTSNEKWYGSA